MSSTAPGRVVVVGNLTIDDVVRPDGQTLMGRLGGNTVHSATAVLASGVPVALVARKGEDFPDDALVALAEAGADLSGLRPIEGPTVRNWVVYESDGRRHWLYRTPEARSAQVAPDADDLTTAVLAGAGVVHVAAMPLANAERVVERVRSLAPEALLTLDTHEDWVAPVRDRLLALARAVDLFEPSWEELRELTSSPDPESGLRALAAAGLSVAVVKCGADGAYVLRDGEVVHVPAAPSQAVDTTGAGDTFCGGVAAGLAQGLDVRSAVALGVSVAARAINGSGSLRLLEPAVDPEPYAIDVMRREIEMIPDIVADAVRDADGHLLGLAESLAERGIRHLWLTGCGDSAFAGQAAALAFQRHTDIEVHPVHALDLARYQARYLPEGSAVIGLSFSGKVGRTTEALVQARRFGAATYGLTNDPDGQVAQAAETVIPIEVATLGFSPGTSTYVAMLGRLLRLAAALGQVAGRGEGLLRDLDALPERAAATLDLTAGPALDAAKAVLGQPWTAFLGAGPNAATARFGAAKLFEGPQQLAISTNLEEWAHEEYFVTQPGDPVVLVNPSGAGHDRGVEILDELRFVGARPIVVSDVEPADPAPGELWLPLAPGVSEELSTVTAALPLSLLGFHLAELAGKQSYNFPSEAARTEHYDTIHRATLGVPA